MAQYWMEILRPGRWNDFDFTPKYIRDLEASYDPAIIEAPVVVGHPDSLFGDEKPAYGWVKKLKIRPMKDAETEDDISLWALADLDEEGEAFIKEKKFPKRSIGISEDHPYDGIPYLKHIALLGSSNPAVTELEDIEIEQSLGYRNNEGVLITLAFSKKTMEFRWESKEQEYWYRVRPPERFREDTFRSFKLKGVSGLRAIGGKLKEQYVPEGNDPDSLVIQALRFSKENFSLDEAKKWVQEHKGELSQMTEGTITLNTGTDKQLSAVTSERDKLLAQQETIKHELDEEKKRASAAEEKLRQIELERAEAQFEADLKELMDQNKALPAFIELGLHKALTAIDANGVIVEVDGEEVRATSIILKVLESLPKILEPKEISRASVQESTREGAPPPTTFNTAMATYAAKGEKVAGLNVKELADKLEKDEGLSPRKAIEKAVEMSGGY